MSRFSIKETPYERRSDKRDWVVITNTGGWDRFYEATPELRIQAPARIVHPHPEFKNKGE